MVQQLRLRTRNASWCAVLKTLFVHFRKKKNLRAPSQYIRKPCRSIHMIRCGPSDGASIATHLQCANATNCRIEHHWIRIYWRFTWRTLKNKNWETRNKKNISQKRHFAYIWAEKNSRRQTTFLPIENEKNETNLLKMASQTQGIQQLLAAEKRAAEKVAEARKRKLYFYFEKSHSPISISFTMPSISMWFQPIQQQHSHSHISIVVHAIESIWV